MDNYFTEKIAPKNPKPEEQAQQPAPSAEKSERRERPPRRENDHRREKPQSEQPADDTPVEIIGIRFKDVGKVYYFAPNGIKFENGDMAIVETARGVECGEIVLENRTFFLANRNKTIVLTMSHETASQITGFHSLCVNVPEKQLLKSLLTLEQHAHRGGRNMPPIAHPTSDLLPLTDREAEVMALIAQGYINKEIADRLSIGLATVVTHRKNIMTKLNLKSVSALTIYAVTHGYVDINKI